MELEAEERLAALRAAAVFSEVSDDDLGVLADQMDPRPVAPGEVLCRRGEPSETFFVVVSGGLEVTLDDPVATMGRGDVFGEISLIDGGAATATVTASAESIVLAMAKERFQESIRAREIIALPLLLLMTKRLRRDQRAEGVRPQI